MALTPDDVVTKQFQHVRFKDGFDPDEVDDFLDEIVVEWRKTIEENEQLKAKLAAYESGQVPAAAESAAQAPAAGAEPAPAAAQSSGSLPVTATAGIIELAQRLHDEHVAEGEAIKNKLISEAEAQADKIRADSEKEQREMRERLGRERTSLESKISELKEFESTYRAQLREYIQGQLRDLDETAMSDASAAGQ